MTTRRMAALLTGASLLLALPAGASAQSLTADEAATLREEVARLKAALARVEDRLATDKVAKNEDGAVAAAASAPATQSQPTKAAALNKGTEVEWKGAPELASEGRSFKPKGRIQMDAGYVGGSGAKNDPGLGYSAEFRRLRLGAEGQFNKKLSYKMELEFADNELELMDAFINYKNGGWTVTVGNQNQFQSLDELTGDTSGTFMERAAFTDAFNFERRLGISTQYRLDALTLQAGIFADDVDALAGKDGIEGDENNSFGLDGRVVYAPKLNDTQLHLAASGHWRKLNRVSGVPLRYRQRPFLHGTDSRVLATPSLSVGREVNYGLEAAAVHGPWHFASEAHWMRPDLLTGPTPTLFGSYAEVGYFLTKGDSRPYSNTAFGAANPKNPIDKGGIGAVQLNLRYDYLDLNTGDFLGGKQNAYLASVVWTPLRYLRLNLNYGYLEYDDAALVLGGRRNYGLHMLATRMELDF